MKVYLISYWQLTSSQTASNRLQAFVDALEVAGYTPMVFCYANSGKKSEPSVRNRVRDFITTRLNNFIINAFYSFFVTLLKPRERFALADFTNGELSLADCLLSTEDCVITSGPPHAIFTIGSILKTKFGCKWIMDYRDPWTYGYSLPPFDTILFGLKKRLIRKQEIAYLKQADKIITVSESLKGYYPKTFANKIAVVENGANLNHIDVASIVEKPEVFSIVYSGSVYNVQLQDTSFFTALTQFIAQEKLNPNAFRLIFLGSNSNPYLQKFIDKCGLTAYTTITPRLPLQQVLEYLYAANIFLHLRYGTIGGIITSKVYDYLALQKKVLLPQTDNGDIANILEYHGAGIICKNEEQIISELKNAYHNHLTKQSFTCKRTPNEIHELSRDFKTKKLIELIQDFK